MRSSFIFQSPKLDFFCLSDFKKKNAVYKKYNQQRQVLFFFECKMKMKTIMFKCFRENTFFPLRLVLVHSNPAINQIEKKKTLIETEQALLVLLYWEINWLYISLCECVCCSNSLLVGTKCSHKEKEIRKIFQSGDFIPYLANLGWNLKINSRIMYRFTLGLLLCEDTC